MFDVVRPRGKSVAEYLARKCEWRNAVYLQASYQFVVEDQLPSILQLALFFLEIEVNLYVHVVAEGEPVWKFGKPQ